MDEKTIMLTSKLYRCRKAMKGLFQDQYIQKIHPYRELIERVMESTNQDNAVAVAIDIGKNIKEGMALALLFSASVETAENDQSTMEQ